MRQLLGPRRKQPGVSYNPWYCPGPGRLGFYNNWFVTKISWWLEDHRVAALIGAFDPVQKRTSESGAPGI